MDNFFCNLVQEININTLSGDDRENCKGSITRAELQQAMKSMTSDKSPGLDGINADFYKEFST